MKIARAIICAAFIVCLGQAAWALEWQIAPLVGYTMGGSFELEDEDDIDSSIDLSLKEAGSFGLAIDVEAQKDTQYEFYYGFQPTELKIDEGVLSGDALLHLDVHYFQIGGTVALTDNKSLVRPFIVGTLGVTHFNPRSSGFDSLTRPSLGLGIGAFVPILKHVGIRVEGRGMVTLVDSSAAVFSNNNGLTVRVASDTFTQFILNAGVFFSF